MAYLSSYIDCELRVGPTGLDSSTASTVSDYFLTWPKLKLAVKLMLLIIILGLAYLLSERAMNEFMVEKRFLNYLSRLSCSYFMDFYFWIISTSISALTFAKSLLVLSINIFLSSKNLIWYSVYFLPSSSLSSWT